MTTLLMKKKLNRFKRKLRMITKLRTKINLKTLIKLKGSPHELALGTAIGIFWNFIPSLGIGWLLSAGIARFLKVSALVALMVNLATGFFIPFFYSLNLITGRMLLRRDIIPEEAGDTLQQSLLESLEVLEIVVEEPIQYFSLDKLQSVSGEFIAGSIINALLVAGITYVIFFALLKYRRHRQEKRREH